MSEFKKGQRVKVEIEGTVSAPSDEGIYVHPAADKSYAHFVWVDHAKVTPLDPPDWPPQVGDIWEAEGREWFARKRPYSESMFLTPGDGEDDWLRRDFKALNPVLVRRRNAHPAQPVCVERSEGQ